MSSRPNGNVKEIHYVIHNLQHQLAQMDTGFDNTASIAAGNAIKRTLSKNLDNVKDKFKKKSKTSYTEAELVPEFVSREIPGMQYSTEFMEFSSKISKLESKFLLDVLSRSIQCDNKEEIEINPLEIEKLNKEYNEKMDKEGWEMAKNKKPTGKELRDNWEKVKFQIYEFKTTKLKHYIKTTKSPKFQEEISFNGENVQLKCENANLFQVDYKYVNIKHLYLFKREKKLQGDKGNKIKRYICELYLYDQMYRKRGVEITSISLVNFHHKYETYSITTFSDRNDGGNMTKMETNVVTERGRPLKQEESILSYIKENIFKDLDDEKIMSPKKEKQRLNTKKPIPTLDITPIDNGKGKQKAVGKPQGRGRNKTFQQHVESKKAGELAVNFVNKMKRNRQTLLKYLKMDLDLKQIDLKQIFDANPEFKKEVVEMLEAPNWDFKVKWDENDTKWSAVDDA